MSGGNTSRLRALYVPYERSTGTATPKFGAAQKSKLGGLNAKTLANFEGKGRTLAAT